jgi:hypothetical protein
MTNARPSLRVFAVICDHDGQVYKHTGWDDPIAILRIEIDELAHYLEVTGRARSKADGRAMVERLIESDRWTRGEVQSSLADWLLRQIDPRTGRKVIDLPDDEILRCLEHIKPQARELRKRLIAIARREVQHRHPLDPASIWRAFIQEIHTQHRRLVLAGELRHDSFEEWFRDGGQTLIEAKYGSTAAKLIPLVNPDVGVRADQFPAHLGIAYQLAGKRLNVDGNTVRNRVREHRASQT